MIVFFIFLKFSLKVKYHCCVKIRYHCVEVRYQFGVKVRYHCCVCWRHVYQISLSKVCFVENLIFSLHWESSVHVCCLLCLIEDYIFSVMHLPPPILKVLTIIHNLHIELKYIRFHVSEEYQSLLILIILNLYDL